MGENLAVEYLTNKGFHILDRNYRYERGEVDIVAEDNNVLVFIEVKARHTKMFGEPEDAVTPSKRVKIRKIADGYLFKHDIDDRECRFDIIAIDYQQQKPVIRHIENAF